MSTKGPPSRQTLIEAYVIVQLRLTASGESGGSVGHMMYVYAEQAKKALGCDAEAVLRLAIDIDTEIRAKAIETTRDWTT